MGEEKIVAIMSNKELIFGEGGDFTGTMEKSRPSAMEFALTLTKGVRIYKNNRPDCVFLDGNLPDINGEEVFKRIKRIDFHADIYFLTGDDSFEKKAQELGAKGYLPKPINITKILNIISTN